MPCDRAGERPGYLCVSGVRLLLMLERARVLLHLMETARAKADLEQAAALAEELADLDAQGKALLEWAEILVHQAQYVEAMARVRRAMQCFEALGDRRRMVRAWKLQSRIHAALGQPAAAVRCAQRAGGSPYGRYLGAIYFRSAGEALDAAGAHSDRRQVGISDWSVTIEEPAWLAQAAVYRGEWGRALRLARDGIAAAWALGTPLDVADAKWVLALALACLGAYEEAEGHLDEAMAAYLEAGWKRGQVSGLWLKGQIGWGLGREGDAAASFEQAWRYGQETHTLQAIVRAEVGLGRLAAVRGQWSRAERWCVEARARARQSSLGVAWVEAQVGVAHVYLEGERWELARVQAAQAREASCGLRFPALELDSTRLLGRAWEGLGERGRARSCRREADDLARQLAEELPPEYARQFGRRAELERR